MNEILTSCFAVVGSLCLQDSATAEIRYGTGWSGAVITDKNGVVISSMTGSDAIVTPYTPKMYKVCSKNDCLFYKAGCTASGTEMKCTIWYSYHPSMPLRQIEITGAKDSVQAAIGHIKLVRSHRLIIPLASLQYDASDSLPPTCYSRAGCKRSKE
jgi:hypothetical protein